MHSNWVASSVLSLLPCDLALSLLCHHPGRLRGLTGRAPGLSFTRCHGSIHLWALLLWRAESSQRRGWGKVTAILWPTCSWLSFPGLSSAGLGQILHPWSPNRLAGTFPNLSTSFVSGFLFFATLFSSHLLGYCPWKRGHFRKHSDKPVLNPRVIISWPITGAVSLKYVPHSTVPLTTIWRCCLPYRSAERAGGISSDR